MMKIRGRGEVYFSKSEIRIISYTIAAERESDNEWSETETLSNK